MATHSSVLAWRIPGTEGPGGLLSMGSHRVRHNWSVLAAVRKHTQYYFRFYKFVEMCFMTQNVVFLGDCSGALEQCVFCWFWLGCKCPLGENGWWWCSGLSHICAGFLTMSSSTMWGVLNSPPIIVCLFLLSVVRSLWDFRSLTMDWTQARRSESAEPQPPGNSLLSVFCFVHFESLMLGECTFIIALPSWWIDFYHHVKPSSINNAKK